MKGLAIALSAIVMLAAYIIWLAGKPAQAPLLDEATEEQLSSAVPPHGTDGNSLDIYTGFDAMVEALERDIQGASVYVHLIFFKYEDDPVGRRLAGLMARKVAEGVEVRLMVDDAVNMGRRKLYSDMKAAGIQVRGYSPLHVPLRKSDNYRNHRKIVVVDGKVAYIGGMNIAERYGTGLEWGCWRDTQIRIVGPAAADCELAFARDWTRMDAPGSEPVLSNPRYYADPLPQGGTNVEIVCSGPVGEGPVVMERLCSMLDSARDYVWLESPYLIPTKEVKEALCGAARRGVDVRLIIPPKGDRGVLTPLATKAYIQEVLDSGVRIATYDKGYMHSKTAVCDDRLATVGSTNIDVRSYLLDLEVNAFMDDPAFAARMKRVFQDDESCSTFIDPAAWKKRSFFSKAAESFAKLFSFQL